MINFFLSIGTAKKQKQAVLLQQKYHKKYLTRGLNIVLDNGVKKVEKHTAQENMW